MAALPDVAAGARIVDLAEASRLSPLLRDGYVAHALSEEAARDIDVNALHQGYLRRVRAKGGELRLDSGVSSLERARTFWRARTPAGDMESPLLVNAAGAWADHVGAMAGAAPIGLTPRRRTVVLVEGGDEPQVAASAMTIDIDEQFYFKPDAGLLLLSPADEIAVDACDAQLEEIDVAVAIDRGGTSYPPSGAPCSREMGRIAQLRRRPPPGGGVRSRPAGLFLAGGTGGLRHPDRAGHGASGGGPGSGRGGAERSAEVWIEPGGHRPAATGPTTRRVVERWSVLTPARQRRAVAWL